ncbi:MAG: hypothetical protein ACU826_05890 [Gammaproteobacteria bacterium]
MKPSKERILQALNPADSFTLAMDEEIRKEGMPGSYGGFALELSRKPDAAGLEKRIDEFTGRFPVALASLQRFGRRFYWCRRDSAPRVFFRHACPPGRDEEVYLKTEIERLFNLSEPRETVAPIEFHLLESATKNTFVLRWIHPFCDARGADLIVQFLCTDDKTKRDLFEAQESASLVNLHLKKFSWWKKFGLFLKAKKYIRELDSLKSAVPFAGPGKPERLSYSLQRLSEEQTAAVTRNIRKHVGITGTSLYYIGCLMRALEKLASEPDGEAYCVPYAFNLRRQKALSPVTGNHVCALFAQAPREIVRSREKLFSHLKRQNAQVIRDQVDYAFLPLMWAGSWLTLDRYGNVLRRSFGSGDERSSFWFSDIGQPDLSGRSLLGAEIRGLFMLCQVTSPPALALLTCIFNNRLTLAYSHMEPLVGAGNIARLQELMLTELLEEAE